MTNPVDTPKLSLKSRLAAMIVVGLLPDDNDFINALSVRETAYSHLDEEMQRLSVATESGDDRIRIIEADVKTLRIGVNSLLFGALSVPVTRPASIRRKIELALQHNFDLADLFPILADLKRLETITG
jgi:hypothetical protein